MLGKLVPDFAGEAGSRYCPDAGSALSARVGCGLPELRHLEDHWRNLVAVSVRSRFMHLFEWQQAYLEHLENRPEATHYFSFFANGRAIAIFPLRRVRRSVGRIPLWLWELPTHPHLILAEPLISPEWAGTALIRRLVETLDQCRGLPWDALHLPNLLDDALTLQPWRDGGLPRMHLEKTEQSMYFRCSGLGVALSRCSGPFLRNLHRQGRKLARLGEVTLSLVRQGDELEAAFEDFLRLEASGWKGKRGRGSAIRLHPNLLGFYRQLKDDFARIGSCLITLLKLDGTAIAGQFCLQVEDTVYIQKIAYDETWHAEAPGNQLLYRLIEHCCADPAIEQVSLVTAPAWAVGRWNPQCQEVWEAYFFRANPRGLAGLAMRRFKLAVGKPARLWWKRARARRAGPAASGV